MPVIIWTDLDLNFINNPITGDISLTSGDLAIIRSIENLVQLNHYEYPFNPSIGSNVEKLLFELATETTANAIAKEITNVLNNYEDRATNYVVNATIDPSGLGYNIYISFFINNSTQAVAISMFLERII